MRRIVWTGCVVLLALSLVSCEDTVEPAKPVAREKTPSERVDSVLLSCVNALSALDYDNFLECIDIIVDRRNIFRTRRVVSISGNDGEPILSVSFGLDFLLLDAFEMTFADRVYFAAQSGIPILELYLYIKECMQCDSDEEAVAVVEAFNGRYDDVTVNLDREEVGVVRMKTWENDGKLYPAFVLDYYDGSSCYLQLFF